MRDTFLFDLDGTLLPMDFDKFMKLYFYNLGKHFEEEITPKDLSDFVLSSTKYMIQTKNNQTNEEKFMDYFGKKTKKNMSFYKKQFDVFYDTLFENVKPSTYQSNEIIKSIQLLKEKGYNVVIATNPLFPLKANVHRIKWAGLDYNDFTYVSSFEENKYTKPHIEYYQEVLEKINKKPEECYMVGNDVFDDLPAKKIGIETYLITDCLLNHYDLQIDTNYQGSYQDFYDFIKDLNPINTAK